MLYSRPAWLGKVAKAPNGSVGVVFGRRLVGDKYLYAGADISGKHWEAFNPTVIAYSIDEYIDEGEWRVKKKAMKYFDNREPPKRIRKKR